MIPEKLTKLDPARSSDEPTCGGVPELTAHDICFALSIPVERFDINVEGAYRLALYKGLSWEGERNILLNALSVASSHDAMIRKWVAANRKQHEKLCNLALDEIIETNLCRVCDGTGKRTEHKRLVGCNWCKATGYSGFSAKKRAKKIGITQEDWKNCVDTYNRVFQILLNWEYLVSRRLKRRLK